MDRVIYHFLLLTMAIGILVSCANPEANDQGIAEPTATVEAPTEAPLRCLDQVDSQQWVRDVNSLLSAWNDEISIVMQTPRASAAEASRELRNLRRQLREMETPNCLESVRDQILYQLSGGLASLDGWINESGDGMVFAFTDSLSARGLLTELDASPGAELCNAPLDAQWVRTISDSLQEWNWNIGLLKSSSALAKADEIKKTLKLNETGDCAKAAVLNPMIDWMETIQAIYEVPRNSGRLQPDQREDLVSVFLAVVDEYNQQN